jgi:hypothetical protein
LICDGLELIESFHADPVDQRAPLSFCLVKAPSASSARGFFGQGRNETKGRFILALFLLAITCSMYAKRRKNSDKINTLLWFFIFFCW